jgi:D-alanyl-lipoteichoic acid acyltransferase DltB (MBOAT superfamily)
MLFYTVEFLIFSLLLLASFALVHRNEPRKIILLLASYVFYMWWNPVFIVLILFATFFNYGAARLIEKETDPGRRKAVLIAGLVGSLGLLGYFKYAGFLAENTLVLMQLLGFEVHWTSIQIMLPVGISFFTFQALSYTIDVYRRDFPANHSALDFALYIAFFPQLVAGPIIRAIDFLPQLEKPIQLSLDQRAYFLILRGLAKKVLVADNIAVLADLVFATPEAFPSVVVWLGAICFAIQIYCDFSGYSDIAIGISRIFGFWLPLNFDHPYFARNPSDFWRRWHISLSSWLRDYLYISMGGNRGGKLATYRNLMMTMLLGGLWHGASWNFVLWGFIHGFILVVHRIYQDIRRRNPAYRPAKGPIVSLISIAAMQYFVLLAWIAFRVSDLDALETSLRKFVFFDFDFGLANIGLGGAALFSSTLIMLGFGLLHLASERVGHFDRYLARVSIPVACAISVVVGMAACLLWPLSDVPFIYFQF